MRTSPAWMQDSSCGENAGGHSPRRDGRSRTAPALRGSSCGPRGCLFGHRWGRGVPAKTHTHTRGGEASPQQHVEAAPCAGGLRSGATASAWRAAAPAHQGCPSPPSRARRGRCLAACGLPPRPPSPTPGSVSRSGGVNDHQFREHVLTHLDLLVGSTTAQCTCRGSGRVTGGSRAFRCRWRAYAGRPGCTAAGNLPPSGACCLHWWVVPRQGWQHAAMQNRRLARAAPAPSVSRRCQGAAASPQLPGLPSRPALTGSRHSRHLRLAVAALR